MIDVPTDWDTNRIGRIFDIKQGKSLSRRKQTGNNRKHFLRTSNVFWGRLDFSSLDQMDFTDDECVTLALQPGDLLVCEGGDIGRTAIWQNEVPDCYYQNHLHRLRRLTPDVSPFFFMYWMQASMTQLNVYEGAWNKTTIPNLSRSRLSEFEIPVPPFREQKKIAAVLLKIQRAIETQEKIIQSLLDLKKSTMQHVFTRGLRGEKTKMTEIGEIPESWKVIALGSFSETVTKGSSPRWQGFAYRKSGVLFLRSQNVGWGRLLLDDVAYVDPSFNEKETRSIIRRGDLLINLVGASIGRAAVADERLEGANTNQAVGIARLSSGELVPEFAMYFLLTDAGQGEISYNKKEIARANISLTDIKNFRVPKPSPAEQRDIVQTLHRLDDAQALRESKKSALQDLFKTTLNKLMTGDIRVAALDIDMSEVEG